MHTVWKANMLSRANGVWWKCWDNGIRKISRIQPLNQDESSLFCTKRGRYLGPHLSVDGVEVRPFDPVIELHMNNHLVSQMVHNEDTLFGVAIKLLKETKRSLHTVAEHMGSDADERIQVLYGVTLIHRGVDRLGFRVLPIENKFVHTIVTWYLRNIFRAFNANANLIMNSRSELFEPKMIIMSKQQLINSYRG